MYLLYNWGYKSVTGQNYNTSDQGCQFLFTFVKEEEGPAVGLESVLAPEANCSSAYDLQGRPASSRSNGVFIVNRKKVVR